MAAERKTGKSKTSAAKNKKSARSDESASVEDSTSEINEPHWSVVSFEKCVAANLTYAEAVAEIERLRKQRVSGLCIVTDEAAARISAPPKSLT